MDIVTFVFLLGILWIIQLMLAFYIARTGAEG